MFDLVIRDVMLIDGLGLPPKRGGVAVKDGRIVEVGYIGGASRVTVDADGLALMPGIIDNHTHYDAQITWDPWASPSPALGVTTAIIGNCGFTIAPCRPRDRDLVMRNLTQVEGMSLDVLRAGIRWDFESVPQYLDMLERNGAALNLAAFAGHSSIRTYVMGDAATERGATPEEVRAMKDLLLEAMRAGAIGFSTSTSPAHNGGGGKPMPSRLATEDEMRALVCALREVGRGVFMLTKGGHTRIPFLEELARDSTRPVVVAALLHNSTNPDSVFADLDAIAAAQANGYYLVGAVSCCPLSLDFMLDLALAENLDTVFSALLLNSDEAAVGRMLRHPASLVSLSDAGAHLTFFNDAGFGLHLLGHWVRERGELTLADAVWRLTGQPAKLFGLRGRGALRPGYQADLLLFDPATVDRGPKRRVFDLPGGHPRLT